MKINPIKIIESIRNKWQRYKFCSQFKQIGVGSGFGPNGYGDTCRISDKSLITVGNNTWFGRDSIIQVLKTYRHDVQEQQFDSSLEIGNNVHCTEKCWILCAGHMVIEDDVLIAPEVFITDNNHGTTPGIEGGYANQPLTVSNIHIENGVWLGQRCTVLPGVRIGAHSIIGANSTVTHDIPPYSIAVGNPAKVIKRWDKANEKWVRTEQ